MNMTRLPLAALLASAAVLPFPTFASECAHVRNIDLALDLAGVETVVFEVNSHDLEVRATPAGDGRLQGRACASQQVHLDRLEVRQVRTGDRLVVRLHREDLPDGFVGGVGALRDFVFGGHSSGFELVATITGGLDVQMDIGSGDGIVGGAASLRAAVGSGDLRASDIAGRVTLSVGSGDVQLEDIDSLRVDSIGSGDVTAARVRGDATVGSIGSGGFDLYGAGGEVEVGTVGSGDAGLHNVEGSVRVGSVGSGDIEVTGVRGDLVVRGIGSGEIEHRGVGGRVDLPADD